MTNHPSLTQFVQKTPRGKILPLFLALIVCVLSLISFISPTAVVDASSLISIEKNTSGNVVLSWTPFDGDLDGYTVYINGVKSTLDEYADTSLDVTSSLTTPGQYFFTVYTRFNGTSTTYASITYDHRVAMLAVNEVRLNGNEIVWDSVSGASGYYLYVEGIYFGTYTSCRAAVADRLILTKRYYVSVLPYSSNAYYIAPPPGSCALDVSRTGAVEKLYLSVFNNELSLSWSPVNGASSYKYTVLPDTKSPSEGDVTVYSTTATCLSISSFVTDGDTTYAATVAAFDGVVTMPYKISFKFKNGEVILV